MKDSFSPLNKMVTILNSEKLTNLNIQSGEGKLSRLRSRKKQMFERQKSGHLSEMKNNPFQRITCIPVNIDAPSVSQDKDCSVHL